MAEVGYPEVDIGLWSGFFVTANTPPVIVKKLEDAMRRALADATVRERLARDMAVDPGGGTGEEFRKRIDGDIAKFADVVKTANLKFEEF